MLIARIIVGAVCRHTISGAAESLGVSRFTIRRRLNEIQNMAVNPGPIIELRRRRSTIHMSDLHGSELSNAISILGSEPSLRR